MIQSFSIVFAGYKMPACLRPGLSSSSPLAVTWPGLGLRSVPITGTIRHYTLYSTLSHTPYSHLLSTLSIDQWPQTNIRHWRDVKEDASCVAGLGLFLASHEQGITGDSNACCQTGRDGCKQETSVKLISSILPRILWLTLDEAEREKVFISPGWVQGRALTVRNISFKPLQGYNSFNLIVIQHFGYFFSSAGCGLSYRCIIRPT